MFCRDCAELRANAVMHREAMGYTKNAGKKRQPVGALVTGILGASFSAGIILATIVMIFFAYILYGERAGSFSAAIIPVLCQKFAPYWIAGIILSSVSLHKIKNSGSDMLMGRAAKVFAVVGLVSSLVLATGALVGLFL